MQKLFDMVRRQRETMFFDTSEALLAFECQIVHQMRLQEKYLSAKIERISAVSLETAKTWLAENGLELRVVNEGKLWCEVKLNDIERGLLAEKHILTLPIDNEAKKPDDEPSQTIEVKQMRVRVVMEGLGGELASEVFEVKDEDEINTLFREWLNREDIVINFGDTFRFEELSG